MRKLILNAAEAITHSLLSSNGSLLPPSPMSPPPPSASSSSHYLSALGLGYSITITLAFLVLLSSLLLASYLCCRSSHHPFPADGGIMLPRVIFVAEDDHGPDLESDAAVGLDQTVINSYPKFPFTKGIVPAGDDAACSICLCDYKELEMLRMMPECRHYFHASCLDVWLKLNGSCPVCRNSPLPTPISTPLREVVPLSQYAADRRRWM